MSNWHLDLSHSSLKDKTSRLESHPEAWHILDLTTYDPRPLFSRFPQLKAVCSTQLNHGPVCEVYSPSPLPVEAFELLRAQGLNPLPVSYCGPGLISARVLATIINEAFYALGERIATADDIDRAMRFGVGYPRGPLEWAQGKESIVIELLMALQIATGDHERYQPAPRLLELAKK